MLMVTKSDFDFALEHDVKPAFGISDDELDRYVKNGETATTSSLECGYHTVPAAGIIQWGPPVDRVLQRGKLTVEQIRDTSHTYLTSMLIKGRPSSGKTALAVEIARTSDFPFIKVISPRNMIGYHETSKCQAIKKVSLSTCCCNYPILLL